MSSCFPPVGGVGPTVSDLSGVTALHAGYSNKLSGFDASHFIHKSRQFAGFSLTGTAFSLVAVPKYEHVPAVCEQRESRLLGQLKGKRMKTANFTIVYCELS